MYFEQIRISPKGLMALALYEHGFNDVISQEQFDLIWKDFEKSMKETKWSFVDGKIENKKAITERSKRAQEVEEAKQRQEKAKIEAETKRVEAKGEADAAIERAKGEAEANEIVSKSLTENLLKQQELEARQKHGWVTIQGANTIVDNTK